MTCDCQTLQQRIELLEEKQKDLSDNLHRLTNAVQARLLKIELRNLGLEVEPENETEQHDDRHNITTLGAARRANSNDAGENRPTQQPAQGDAERVTGGSGGLLGLSRQH